MKRWLPQSGAASCSAGHEVVTSSADDAVAPVAFLYIVASLCKFGNVRSCVNIQSSCRGSLRRLQMDQLAIGQLHWSAAKYAPLQVRQRRVYDVLSKHA